MIDNHIKPIIIVNYFNLSYFVGFLNINNFF